MQNSEEISKHHENAWQSVEMLRAVIGGEPYEAVAVRFGVSRTAVERRIKARTFPEPVKLSERVTVWRAEDIRRWIAQQGQPG